MYASTVLSFGGCSHLIRLIPVLTATRCSGLIGGLLVVDVDINYRWLIGFPAMNTEYVRGESNQYVRVYARESTTCCPPGLDRLMIL